MNRRTNFIVTAIIGAVVIFGGMYLAKKVLYTDGDLPCWGKYNQECK
jgi:hypothetical protein